jgi:transposase
MLTRFAEPYRHQIVEIPRFSPYVIEHQQHQLECACCGKKTISQGTKEKSPRLSPKGMSY